MSVQKAQKGLNYTIKLREAGTESMVLDKLTSNTATVFDVLTEKLESSGTAAASLGLGHGFQIENAGGTVAERGRYDLVMTTATANSEDAEWQFKVAAAGTMTKILTVDKNGINVVGGINPSGTSAFTGRVTTTDGVSSGTAKVVGGLAYSNTAASTAVTSTATETLFDTSYTIPANTLKAGTVIKMRWQGIATGTANTDTLTVKAYIGGLSGTALCAGTATDVANNAIFSGETTLICRTAGASGTFVAVTKHTEVPAASGTAVEDVTEIVASTTINTTTTQVIGVSGKWSTTDTVNTCRLDIIAVEIY